MRRTVDIRPTLTKIRIKIIQFSINLYLYLILRSIGLLERLPDSLNLMFHDVWDLTISNSIPGNKDKAWNGLGYALSL